MNMPVTQSLPYDIIQLRRGPLAKLPTWAEEGEPLVTTDSIDLFVGQGEGLDLIRITDLVQVNTFADLPKRGIPWKVYIVQADEGYNDSVMAYIWVQSITNYRPISAPLPFAIDDDAITGTDVVWSVAKVIKMLETHEHTSSQIADLADAVKKIISSIINIKGGIAGIDELTGFLDPRLIPPSFKEGYVVDDIAARDAISPLYAGMRVYVVDATADPTVESGDAEYIYTGKEWRKVSEGNAIDVVINWTMINGGPKSSPSQIDAAVEQSHGHPNFPSIDKIGTNEQGDPTWNNESFPKVFIEGMEGNAGRPAIVNQSEDKLTASGVLRINGGTFGPTESSEPVGGQ